MDIIEILKNAIPATIMICGLYYTLQGRISVLELRLDNKKARIDKLEARIDKLEDQKENNTKNFQELIHSIDKLNNNFVNLEKRLDKSDIK